MRKLIASLCIFLSIILFFSCDTTFRRTESGLQYRIFEKGSGAVATAGSTVKLHYTQMLHDTITSTTVGKLPIYKELIPGTIFPYDPFEVLVKGVRPGDSIVVVQRLDSLLKKGKRKNLPPHLKPEDELIVTMKILQVFPFQISNAVLTDSLIRADKMAERRKMDSLQDILGPKRVEEYLQKKNITASRNEHATYVEIIRPGEGPPADSGKTVLLRYKVSTLKGKMLDANMDTSANPEPMRFTVGSGYMPRSVDQSIRKLKKGGHARIYIPAMVVMREMPNENQQPDYDDMIFEVIVEDVQ